MNTLQLIVPCFNESEVIDMFYSEVMPIIEALPDISSELIFVDDGSKDDTLEKIKKLSEKDSRLKYISFSRNFGKEGAMLAGLRYSTADYVGFIDADLQHSPSLIPEMLKAVINEGYDVAAAKRSDREGENKLKSKLSDSFYEIINKLSSVEIDSGAQDFRIMRRCVADAILSMTEYNRFTKGIFSYVGFKTKWFAHENRERAAGETKWSFKSLLKYAVDGILAFSEKPLKIPVFFGCFTVFAGLAYLLLILILHFTAYSFLYEFNHVVIALILFMSGVIIGFIGILGEYVGRIYSEVKNRPRFIVRETNITDNKA